WRRSTRSRPCLASARRRRAAGSSSYPGSKRPAWPRSPSGAVRSPTSRRVSRRGGWSKRSSGSCSRRLETPVSPDMAVRDASDDPLAGLTADELLRVLGHEIGNLVTIVSGYGQMLRDHWEFLADDRRLDIVARMNRQVDQLRVLIDNFQHLRWLTVTNHDLSALAPTTDISDLLNALADDLVPLADDHPLEIEVEDALLRVVAARASLQHVLMNLVVNATKFSPPEAPIAIDVRRDGDDVSISVTDHGVGIPPDKRDRIFEKFVRLQDGGVGVGLGLFICRALVEAMGGRIWAGEGPDGGARMTFTLPVAK